MVKPGSSSPEPPYTIFEIKFLLLSYDDARSLPLPPTPPELIRDDSPLSRDYTPRLPAYDPVLFAALERLHWMSAFLPEEDDVDR